MFIIGDIEAFGYESDFQELWGVFKENGTLKSILLRFHDSFIPYSKEEFAASDYEALLSAYKPLKLSGKSTIVERFETSPTIQLGAKNDMSFCECLDNSHLQYALSLCLTFRFTFFIFLSISWSFSFMLLPSFIK